MMIILVMFQTTLCNLSVRNRGIYYKNDIFVMVSDNSVKDVTARYSSQWLTHTRKNRIDPLWWTETLMAFDSTSYNDNLLEDDEIKSRRLFYISSIFHSSSLSCLLPLFLVYHACTSIQKVSLFFAMSVSIALTNSVSCLQFLHVLFLFTKPVSCLLYQYVLFLYL